MGGRVAAGDMGDGQADGRDSSWAFGRRNSVASCATPERGAKASHRRASSLYRVNSGRGLGARTAFGWLREKWVACWHITGTSSMEIERTMDSFRSRASLFVGSAETLADFVKHREKERQDGEGGQAKRFTHHRMMLEPSSSASLLWENMMLLPLLWTLTAVPLLYFLDVRHPFPPPSYPRNPAAPRGGATTPRGVMGRR